MQGILLVKVFPEVWVSSLSLSLSSRNHSINIPGHEEQDAKLFTSWSIPPAPLPRLSTVLLVLIGVLSGADGRCGLLKVR